MRAYPILLACVLAAGAAGAQPAPPQKDALDGVDPVVLLTQGKEVSGKTEFKVSRGGITYLFSSADTKAVFEKDPEKYEIQMGAACARMGPPVKGDVSDYPVVNGKIDVFGSDDCHKKFVAAPEKFMLKPAGTLDAVTTYVETASQTLTRWASRSIR